MGLIVASALPVSLARVDGCLGGPLGPRSDGAPDDEGFVDYSYINHVVVNGAVVACSFDEPNDAVAVEVLAAAYPGREVVTVDARPLFARGGAIHCITQQQPAV